MYPILFKIGSFSIYSYNVFLSLAFLFGLYLVMRQAKIERIDEKEILSLSIYLLISTQLGARIFCLLFEQRIGSIYYGAGITGMIVTLLYSHRKQLSFWKIVDIYTLAVALSYAIVKIGCFLNGCCYGKFLFIPIQLIEVFISLIVFLILITYRKYQKKKGELFLLYVMFYGVFRFFVEYFRQDYRVIIFNLFSINQFISILLIIIASIILNRKLNENLSERIEVKVKNIGIEIYLIIVLIIIIPVNFGCVCPDGYDWSWTKWECVPESKDTTIEPTPFDFFKTPIDQNIREIQNIYNAGDKVAAKNAWNNFVKNKGYILISVGDNYTDNAYNDYKSKLSSIFQTEADLVKKTCKGIYRHETKSEGGDDGNLTKVTKVNPFKLNPDSSSYGITQFIDDTTMSQIYYNNFSFTSADVVSDIGQKLVDISNKEDFWNFLSTKLNKDPRSDIKKCLAMAMVKFDDTKGAMERNGINCKFQLDRASVQILAVGHMGPGIVTWVFKNNSGVWNLEKVKEYPQPYAADAYYYAKRIEVYVFGEEAIK